MSARTFPSALASVLLTLLVLSSHGAALIVPMPGWTPLHGDANDWADATGQCVLREERHGQAFPQFTTHDDALLFAVKLQSSLGRSVSNVVTQPVDRGGQWGVLAAYDYQQAGVKYRVSQLFLSDSGVLRTVTGSSAALNTAACVPAMRDFIRYLAN
ncbi:hypothetical protein [Deinococcus sp.]|uniref:hypothetical protein n=1 Tax=Deinococcus sp. TaxID=47478 RepID=UPI0025C5CC29|nr:hypothetical protein [Deinococcus sp.]